MSSKGLRLHFLGNTIILYASQEILNKIYDFWARTLDVFRTDNILYNTWTILCYSTEMENAEISVDYYSRIIKYHYNSKYSFHYIISLIKELFVKLSLSQGIIWLHGCAFHRNGITTLIIGPKGCGKTTWLLTALLKNECFFIANDQFPVILINGIPNILKWKPDIKVTQNTMDLLGISTLQKIQPNERYLILKKECEYLSYDYKGHYEITGQKIYPYRLSFNEDGVKKSYKINNIVFLSSNIDHVLHMNKYQITYELYKLFWNDQECLTPQKLRDWDIYANYWNKRITELSINDGAISNTNHIIQQISNSCRGIKCNSRLLHKEIIDIIDNL